MSKLQRLKILLEKGYFPEELPPPFVTENFARHRSSIHRAWTQLNPTPATRPEIYSYPRIGHSRRSLAIVNPISHMNLAKLIADNWPALRKQLKKSNIATSLPNIIENGDRAIQNPDFAGTERKNLQIYSNYNYFITADVSRFYGSLYTHALPWAILGKDYCKNNLNSPAFKIGLPNQLDVLTRRGQDNQSIGLPIGPDTSRILSEIVISSIDSDLQKKLNLKNNQAVRTIDDWFIGFNSLGEAEIALNVLNALCKSYELELNFEKTRLLDTAKGAKSLWEIDLRSHDLPRKKSQKSSIEHFFSKAFHYQELHPEKNILLYAIKVSRKFDIQESCWESYETYLLACARSNATTIPTCAQILINYNAKSYPLSNEKISKFIFDTIAKHGELNLHGEVAWALFLAKGLKIKLVEKLSKIIANLDSSACALLALDLRERGLIAGKLNEAAWRTYMNSSGLTSNQWLLSYEVAIKGWVKGVSTQYVDNDPYFSILKQKKISFYDIARNVDKLEKTRQKIKRNPLVINFVPGRAAGSFGFDYN